MKLLLSIRSKSCLMQHFFQLFNTIDGAPEAVELGNSEWLQTSCDAVSMYLSFLGSDVAH